MIMKAGGRMHAISAGKASRGGLEGVVAVSTRLSSVDGEAGELIIAGHRVEELADRHGFEAVCHLLWHGDLPTRTALMELRARLGRKRVRVLELLARYGTPAMRDPMDALRSVLARFESNDDLFDDAAHGKLRFLHPSVAAALEAHRG